MKKILFIIIAVFILTGCEATYTINIDDNFNESIYVTSSDSQQLSKINDYRFNNPVYYDEPNISDEGEKISGVSYYDYTYNNGIIASFKFKDNYSRSSAVHYCFPSLKITEDEYVTIRTNVDFRCFKLEPELDKVTINIVTNNNVTSNNADKVTGNTYTWIFERNGSIKSIDLKYKNPNYKKPSNGGTNTNPNNSNSQNNNNKKKSVTTNKTLLIVLLSLFFVSLFGIIIFSKKKKNN